MAIVLAFPTTHMFRVIAEGGRDDSYYLDMASKFVHFIILQTVILLAALLVPTSRWPAIDVIGFGLLVYAVLTVLGLMMSLYTTARIYNHPGATEQSDDKPTDG
jgi:hypothetical protein